MFDGIKKAVARRLLRSLSKGVNAPMLLSSWQYGTDVMSARDFNKQVQEFKSWVYVCASRNAQSAAALPLRLYAYRTSTTQKYVVKTKQVSKKTCSYLQSKAHLSRVFTKAVDFEEVVEHPLLELLRQVNPFMNRYELWELTGLWQEITGNCYWYLGSAAKASPTTQPDQIWILPANKMKVVPDKDNFIKGYVYTNGTMKIPYEPHEIVHFKFPSLDNPYYGMSPLAAVGYAVGINNEINVFEQTMFKNMARPEGVLTTEQNLDDDEFERLKKEWKENYGGVGKVGKTVILEKGLKYEPITFSPKELQYLQGRKWNREEICAAYGVPMSKVTTEAVNLANAYVGERQYSADTIYPRVVRIEEKLNEPAFIGRYGTNMFVAFDNPIPADREFELRERESNLRSYLTSVNEERAKIGLEEVSWGDLPLASMGTMPLLTGEDLFQSEQQQQQQVQQLMAQLERGLEKTMLSCFHEQRLLHSKVVPIVDTLFGGRKVLSNK